MVKHWPTEDILAESFTKPLQDESFTKLKDKIMGIIPFTLKKRFKKTKNIANGPFFEECAQTDQPTITSKKRYDKLVGFQESK